MRLLNPQMREIVARNDIVLNGDIMARKGIFWTIWEHLYFVYYPIISYQWINFYRVERMDIGKISLTH